MPYKDKEAKNAYQQDWYKQNRLNWIKSQGNKCVKCDSTENLEVDHIDPHLKVDHRVYSWSKKRRDIELSKCQVLCKKCHLNKTIDQYEYSRVIQR